MFKFINRHNCYFIYALINHKKRPLKALKDIAYITVIVILNPISFIKAYRYISKNNKLKNYRASYIRSIFLRGRCSLSLSKKSQVNIFIEHHKFINEFLKTHRLNKIDSILWNFKAKDSSLYSIKLFESGPSDSQEGDLRISLIRDTEIISTFGFVVSMQNGCEPSLFLGKIQGILGNYDLVKITYKNFNSLDSTHILIAALEGFCRYFSISKIIATSSKNQMLNDRLSQSFKVTHDSFFLKACSEINLHGDFILKIPLRINRTENSERSHNTSRHKKHVEIRQQISAEVYIMLCNQFGYRVDLSGTA